MKRVPAYSEYHATWYRPRVSTYWWLKRWAHFKFILRELTSVFVAWFVVVLLLQIRALSGGPATYQEFQEWLQSPLLIAVNGVALLFVLFHAVTWFNLAPKAIVVRLQGRRLPDLVISGSNYLAWIFVSAGLAWLLLGA